MTASFLAAWSSVFDTSVFDTVECAPREVPPGGRGPHGGRTRPDAALPRPAASADQHATIDGVPVPDLLARLRDGDQTAFEAFYLALHLPLWRLGVILCGSSEIAEELVQDVFLSVWVRRASFTPDDDIRAYLYAALRNAVKMRGRHGRVVRGVESAIEQETLALPAHAPAPVAPDRAAEGQEFYAAYQRALSALTDRERVALQLRIEEEFTLEQVGQAIGLSKVGARTVVLRAEAKVRALLAEYRT